MKNFIFFFHHTHLKNERFSREREMTAAMFSAIGRLNQGSLKLMTERTLENHRNVFTISNFTLKAKSSLHFNLAPKCSNSYQFV